MSKFADIISEIVNRLGGLLPISVVLHIKMQTVCERDVCLKFFGETPTTSKHQTETVNKFAFLGSKT